MNDPLAQPVVTEDSDTPIRLGVSSCLLGEKVRFDGGHKRDPWLTDILGRYVEWVSVCPELEMGMGVPRETLRLEQKADSTRMVMSSTGDDWTDNMKNYAAGRLRLLAEQDLCGYVLKKNSPSCGLFRVKVYDRNNVPSASGRGLFAAALVEVFPLLPVEEEGRLSDPRLRENFVERLFAFRRLKNLMARRFSVGALVEFHARHKYQILAHSRQIYDDMGRLVADAKGRPKDDVLQAYSKNFMTALGMYASVRKNTNVLQHMAGFFKKEIDPESRKEVQSVIEDYRLGLVPLVVPLTLVRHHVRRFNVTYLLNQTYLEPHPKELMLRNHV